MKKIFITFASLAFVLSSCTPNPKQLKEAIEKDPSIVFVAIEKDPEKFIEVVNVAARNAQKKAMEKQSQDETKKRDDEFANPLKPEVSAKRAIHGPADAKITIVEYSDFQCPYCRQGYKTVKEVIAAYPSQIRVVFKHFPLDGHPKARPAAKYFEAIAKQNGEMAYKFHDLVFENQNQLNEKGEDFLKESAKKAGANMTKLAKDLTDPSLEEIIKADMEEAQKFNVTGTPAFIINGVSLRGAYPLSEFKSIIDKHLGAPAGAGGAPAPSAPAPGK